MPKKKTLILLLAILAVCLLITAGYMFTHRSEMRDATVQEIEAHSIYQVDWQSALGVRGSDKELILSLCAFDQEQVIGDNSYSTYSSDTLGQYLYGFDTMTSIALHDNGILYVQYTDTEGGMVILGYSDAGLAEMAVYDAETDSLFQQAGDTASVWTHFQTGVRFGN